MSNRQRRLELLFAGITAVIAVGIVPGSVWLARYVGSMNTTRVVGAWMTASIAASTPASALPGQLLGGMGPVLTVAQREIARRQAEASRLTQHQVAAVEVIIYVWRRTMWAVAGLLGLAALLVVLTGRGRPFHLAAAGIILLSTLATLVGMWFLLQPRFGGMPPLSAWTYVLVAATQSLYGWVLLVVFARQRAEKQGLLAPGALPTSG